VRFYPTLPQSRPSFVGNSPWALLCVSLEIFHRAGMSRLREKSPQLAGYLEWHVRSQLSDVLDIVTPPKTKCSGSQLSSAC
jgi:kynureninase